MRIDSFKEIAKFCVNRYKDSFDTDNKDNVYVDTLYVSIDKDNNLICSTTPHVLNEANECLLIHRRSALAVTNSYYWYKIEYIDEDGAVTDGVLKNGFSLWTGASGSFSNQIIQLQDEKRVLYNCFTPFETNLQHLWDAYCRLKKAKSDAEIDLINELIEKDEKILDLMREVEGFKFSNYILEKERNQYKKLLNEIRDIVKNKV
jgi:predicted CopG family antitoxin